jgi:hypothetical protein
LKEVDARGEAGDPFRLLEAVDRLEDLEVVDDTVRGRLLQSYDARRV